MNHAGMASRTVSAKIEPSCRPYRSLSPALFDEWLDAQLQCTAGRREFKLGRYLLTRFCNGTDFAEGLAQFRLEVAEYRKVGFLALCVYDETRCDCVEDELWLLGRAMQQAGLAEIAAEVVDGGTVATPIDVVCPVTGESATYQFFSVAFCRHADDPGDPLYDPSLSAPFTAVNTTSDAFAFAMLVRDQSMRAWGCPPHAIGDRMDVERLFRKCVTVWQNMSINTIQNYGSVAVDPRRRVHLSEDRRRWIAPHNDPVFAELSKCPFFHEMPTTYASRLCEKWLAAMFEGAQFTASRDGQSGGTSLLTAEGATDELYQF